ncbi:MAG: putative quinol monooxygenase [Vicinamibacterales bacterium]
MRNRVLAFATGTLAILLVGTISTAGPQAPPPANAPPPEGPRTVVTYVDVVPASEAQAVALLKAYRDTSRRDEGNRGAEVWQQDGPRGRFVIVEQWQDEASRKKHRESQHVAQFHDKLTPLRVSAYDERTHTVFAVGTAAPSSPSAVLVVTHVDVVPTGLPKARELLQAQPAASRAEAGNLRFDVLQGARQNHFTVLEAWRDERARETHVATSHSRTYREGLRETAIDGAPYDERVYRLLP